MALPRGWVEEPDGDFSVVRTLTLGAAWSAIDVRDTTFANEADVAADIAVIGLTPTDLVARGVLRRIDVVNLHETNDTYVSDASPPAPANAYATAAARGPTVSRRWKARRQRSRVYLSAAGASTTVTVEIGFDVPTERT